MSGNAITIDQLAEVLDHTVAINEPLMIWGPPGIGKSESVMQAADRHFAPLYPGYTVDGKHCRDSNGRFVKRPWCPEIRGSLIQSYDLVGLPTIVNGKTTWNPPEGSLLPPQDDDRGGILFIDELMNSDDENVRQALLGLINERIIGNYTLPEKWVIVAASNSVEHGTFAHEMGKHLGTRFWTHVELVVDPDACIRMAKARNWDYRTIGYLINRRDNWMVNDVTDQGNSFPCPRVWEKVQKNNDLPDSIRAACMIGSLGEAVGTDYLQYMKNIGQLPRLSDIVKDPMTAKLPTSPDVMHTVTMTLAANAKDDNVKAFGIYLTRVSEEWSILFFREAERINPELATHPVMTKFKQENAHLYV